MAKDEGCMAAKGEEASMLSRTRQDSAAALGRCVFGRTAEEVLIGQLLLLCPRLLLR